MRVARADRAQHGGRKTAGMTAPLHRDHAAAAMDEARRGHRKPASSDDRPRGRIPVDDAGGARAWLADVAAPAEKRVAPSGAWDPARHPRDSLGRGRETEVCALARSLSPRTGAGRLCPGRLAGMISSGTAAQRPGSSRAASGLARTRAAPGWKPACRAKVAGPGREVAPIHPLQAFRFLPGLCRALRAGNLEGAIRSFGLVPRSAATACDRPSYRVPNDESYFIVAATRKLQYLFVPRKAPNVLHAG